MEQGSKAIINEMFVNDANEDIEQFVQNYIIGPNATKEQLEKIQPAIDSRVNEITKKAPE